MAGAPKKKIEKSRIKLSPEESRRVKNRAEKDIDDI